MDFENMMFTPVMYQDIPSSFMMQPMPMMNPFAGPMMYPTYGVGTMQPLKDDKFERLQQKDNETKQTMLKAGLTLAGIVAIGMLCKSAGAKKAATSLNTYFSSLGLKFKTAFPKTASAASNVKATASAYAGKAKAAISGAWSSFKALFKKPATP